MDKVDLMKRLTDEGFAHVFVWSDAPRTEYKLHAHKGNVAFYITKGAVTITFIDGREVSLKEGDRYEMKPGIKHSAKVGQDGCGWVVGEEIEGDA